MLEEAMNKDNIIKNEISVAAEKKIITWKITKQIC